MGGVCTRRYVGRAVPDHPVHDQRGHPMSDASPDTNEQSPAHRPTVVGIGASAGGLHALKRFFSTVEPHDDIAYVVVVHLAAEQKSHLADVLQPHVAIPVLQVTETTPLES